MATSALSNSTETITNVVFGLTATVISIVTVWQAHRVWKMWREHGREQEGVAPDIELGFRSPQSAPASLASQEREGGVVASAPGQTEDVAASERMPVSTQGPELHPTLPTTVNAEATSSPVLAQGARVDSNGLREVHTQNAQTDLPDTELRPTANDHL